MSALAQSEPGHERAPHLAAPDAPSQQPRFNSVEEEKEFHADSVRQLIRQREVLFAMLAGLGDVGTFANGASMAAVMAAIPSSQSQNWQDIFALLLNQGKRSGYFVEVGVGDGVYTSNTWLLEKHFGWTGILAEPSRNFHNALAASRSAIIDRRCVSDVSGRRVGFVDASDQTKSSMAIHSRETDGAYDVATVSLSDLLVEHEAPQVIDFMSVDCEGHELTILRAFPFDRHRFNMLCVEHHEPAEEQRIKALLSANGYRQVYRAASQQDGFYVPVAPA